MKVKVKLGLKVKVCLQYDSHNVVKVEVNLLLLLTLGCPELPTVLACLAPRQSPRAHRQCRQAPHRLLLLAALVA